MARPAPEQKPQAAKAGTAAKPAKAGQPRKSAAEPVVAKRPARKKPSEKRPAKKLRRKIAKKVAPVLWHPGPPIDSDAALAAGVAALAVIDPPFVTIATQTLGTPPLRRREPGLEGLCWIVVAQQVSTASAQAIFKRLHARFAPFDARELVAAGDDDLRACGLSAPKMRTIRALAGAIAGGGLDLDALATLDAAEAHGRLCAIHGIGPWTADIFLLFCLGHPDAWPAGDLALQEGAKMILGLKQRPDTRQLGLIGERWRPWRGIAARLLWAYYSAEKSREGMALAART